MNTKLAATCLAFALVIGMLAMVLNQVQLVVETSPNVYERVFILTHEDGSTTEEIVRTPKAPGWSRERHTAEHKQNIQALLDAYGND